MLKKLSVMIACLLALPLAAACKSEKSENIVALASFESYSEIQKYRMLNEFGEIGLTYDGECVTEGQAALRVHVTGNYLNPNNYPAIGILTGTGNAVEKTNFEDVSKILLDVYNANDFEAKVYFQYLTRTELGMKLSSRNGVTVPAKTKITAEFAIERNILAQLLNLKSVSQLRIAFDNAARYRQEAREFVIDNLRAVLTDEAIDGNAKVRKDGEIESADREDYLAAWENINSYNYAPSSLTFNSDPDFIKEGTGSFCMTNVLGFGTSVGSTYGGGWKMILPFNDFREYDRIEFWVYVDCTEDVVLQSIKSKKSPGFEDYIYLGLMPHGTWTQVVVDMEQFGTEEEISNFEHFYIVAGFPNTVTCNIYFDGVYAVKG